LQLLQLKKEKRGLRMQITAALLTFIRHTWIEL